MKPPARFPADHKCSASYLPQPPCNSMATEKSYALDASRLVLTVCKLGRCMLRRELRRCYPRDRTGRIDEQLQSPDGC